MLHQYFKALKMLSFGISHKPIYITQVTEQNKMAATWAVPILGLSGFSILRLHFFIENVTPIL